MRGMREWFWMAMAAAVLGGCSCCELPFMYHCDDTDTIGMPAADDPGNPGGIKLTWNQNRSDLDLFVMTPNGDTAYPDRQVIHSGRMSPDVSDGQGFGPEWFSVLTAEPGTYTVKVNYHWHYDQISDVVATVKIYKRGVLDSAGGVFTHTFRQFEANSDSSSNPPNAWVVTQTLTFN